MGSVLLQAQEAEAGRRGADGGAPDSADASADGQIVYASHVSRRAPWQRGEAASRATVSDPKVA